MLRVVRMAGPGKEYLGEGPLVFSFSPWPHPPNLLVSEENAIIAGVLKIANGPRAGMF